MRLHANARLSLKGRELLIDRVEGAGWSLTQAAEAAGVSDRTRREQDEPGADGDEHAEGGGEPARAGERADRGRPREGAEIADAGDGRDGDRRWDIRGRRRGAEDRRRQGRQPASEEGPAEETPGDGRRRDASALPAAARPPLACTTRTRPKCATSRSPSRRPSASASENSVKAPAASQAAA
jgi:transposase IS481 family protein